MYKEPLKNRKHIHLQNVLENNQMLYTDTDNMILLLRLWTRT